MSRGVLHRDIFLMRVGGGGSCEVYVYIERFIGDLLWFGDSDLCILIVLIISVLVCPMKMRNGW